MKAGTTVSKAHASGPERVTKASKSRGQAKESSEVVNTKTHSPDLLLTLEDFENDPDLRLRHWPDFIYVFGCYLNSADILKAHSVIVELIDLRATLKTHLLGRPHIRDEMFCTAADEFIHELLELNDSDREAAIGLRGTHSERAYQLLLRGGALLESSPVAAELRPHASITKFADLAEISRRDFEYKERIYGDQFAAWVARLKSIDPAPLTRAR